MTFSIRASLYRSWFCCRRCRVLLNRGSDRVKHPAGVERDVQACAALKHHGDPNTNACYQKLTRAADPAVQAEGFWALNDFKNANDAFRAANKAHPKDANVRVRWGRMYLEHYQAPDAADLFNEALMLNPGCSAAVIDKTAPQPGDTGPGAPRGSNLVPPRRPM